nr:hypothetical protein [Tanacetum cinerariifolium]
MDRQCITGTSSALTFSPGPSTPPIYSGGSLRNGDCSICKLLLGRIKLLEAQLEMYMHPEQHTLYSTALLNEVYNDMGKLGLNPPKKPKARIIPSPAGILQKALLRKNADVMVGGHDNIMTTQEYVKKVNEDVSEEDHFTLGPWLSAIVHLHGEGVMPSGCLDEMKNNCINGKLKVVVGVVMSCTPNALGDMTVTQEDPTGIMGGTIH